MKIGLNSKHYSANLVHLRWGLIPLAETGQPLWQKRVSSLGKAKATALAGIKFGIKTKYFVCSIYSWWNTHGLMENA
jgi:hypothetical protein